MKRFAEKELLSQKLMPPVIVTLSGQEAALLEEHLHVFESLGFEVEEFGGNEYALRAVPVDLYGANANELFLEVMEQLNRPQSQNAVQSIEEKIASMSCKAAVKGNKRLSRAEAEALIDDLLTLDNPYHCPHGRPTMVAMTKSDMDKKFKRIL
jgi:DNA mismatch repair protein MutL